MGNLTLYNSRICVRDPTHKTIFLAGTKLHWRRQARDTAALIRRDDDLQCDQHNVKLRKLLHIFHGVRLAPLLCSSNLGYRGSGDKMLDKWVNRRCVPTTKTCSNVALHRAFSAKSKWKAGGNQWIS